MRYLLIILSILGISNLHSQLSVTAGFNKDTVVIGDEIKYTISITQDKSISIEAVKHSAFDSIISIMQTQLKAQSDSLEVPIPVVSDFTINNYSRWNDENLDGIFEGSELSFDTTDLGNKYLLENTIDLVFWDPGPQIIKHASLDFRYLDSVYQYPHSGTSQVFVSPPFDVSALESDTLSIVPIKDILREKKNLSDYMFILWTLAGFLGLTLIWFLINRLNRPKQEQQTIIELKKPAHEIALQKLNVLKQEQLWENGKIKEYQSELTYTIREYLENRYGIQALESTTDEIANELKKHNLDSADEMELKNILQVADLVKFAKATPELSIHERFLNKAFEFVNKTKQMLIQSEEQDIDG